MWLHANTEQPDVHVGFRGHFHLENKGEVKIRVSGASWYVIWVDGKYVYEGPDRYHPDFPEYQKKVLELSEGDHLIAIHVHYHGVTTRMLKDIQPFLYCDISDEKAILPIQWKAKKLAGYLEQFKRISPQLAWVEWLDTRNDDYGWHRLRYDDMDWEVPVKVKRSLGEFKKSNLHNVKAIYHSPKHMNEGVFAETFGYEKDNISARFFLRDFECEEYPPQGVWRRYDLGKVRLFRPKFVLDIPAGAEVEFAYSETLRHGRAAPWITLSLDDTYNMDHFIARGGEQEFFPVTPKGGRYVEVHIKAPLDSIHFIREDFVERAYYEKIEGSFESNDELLNRIWKTGMETYMSCSEDALTDNPTRERGQWLGDFGIVGLQIGAAGFSDIKICRRGLVQCAQSSRDDGLVAGLCPGGEAYLSTYAAQWVNGVMDYWRLTEDNSILEELYPYAQKNMGVFISNLSEEGINNDVGWGFIDWGYVFREGKSDMGLNLHVLSALDEMVIWAEHLGRNEDARSYKESGRQLEKIISAYLSRFTLNGTYNWERIGYHATVLAIRAGLISEDDIPGGIHYIKNHILNSFPNNPKAPRLSNPGANNPQLITPYFAHYVFPLLIENGETQFVLDQYRKSWGWALNNNRTTWIEVFDTRWSHCHQWAGSPSWQLSRYMLGLHAQFQKGKNVFDFNFEIGDLQWAKGEMPLPSGNKIKISWQRRGDQIEYSLNSEEEIYIKGMNAKGAPRSGTFKKNKSYTLIIDDN